MGFFFRDDTLGEPLEREVERFYLFIFFKELLAFFHTITNCVTVITLHVTIRTPIEGSQMWPDKPVTLEMKSWTHNHPPFLQNFVLFLFFLRFTVLLWYFLMRSAALARLVVAVILALGSLFLLSYFVRLWKTTVKNQQNISKSSLFDLILFTSASPFFFRIFPHLLNPSVSLSLFGLACVAMCSYFHMFPVFTAVFPTLNTLKMYSRRGIKPRKFIRSDPHIFHILGTERHKSSRAIMTGH